MTFSTTPGRSPEVSTSSSCQAVTRPGRAAYVLDEAELATKLSGGDGYLAIGLREVSPDARLLAYSVDTYW